MNIKKILFLFAFAMTSTLTYASTQAGLPWESPLQTIGNSITGPVAYIFALVGIVVSGIGLIIGGDLQGFFRSAMTLTLVISVIILAAKFLAVAFGVTGAVVI